MKILVAHNRYQQRGGEDVVVEQEIALLRAHGIQVETFLVDNDAITTPLAKVRTAAELTYSWTMRAQLSRLITRFRPDILHVHNSFPRLSPSIYDAADQAGARCPIVQTIHNFRLVCLNGTLFREGRVCQDCIGKAVPWPGVQHRCYRASTAGSASVAFMLAVNRARSAWSRRVDRYLMLTEFARDFFATHTDLPVARMRIKPNAAPDPGAGDGAGGYALFVGRLSPEKGIDVLLQAARLGLGMKLRVAGQGPLEAGIREAHSAGLLEYLGPQSPFKVTALMKRAAVLLVPSLWYEGLPMVVPEAFGTGLPIVASRIGSLAALVDHEQTGLLFAAGSAEGLAAACRRLAADPDLLAKMRGMARAEYLRSYHPENNYRLLRSIYEELVPHTDRVESATAAWPRSHAAGARAGAPPPSPPTQQVQAPSASAWEQQ